MTQVDEPTTIGLSKRRHTALKALKEEGHFAEMADAYRFAIALALAHGGVTEPVTGSRTTVFNVGTLDPDGSIYAAVQALREDTDEAVYRTAEKLAEWGVSELMELASSGEISFGSLLAQADEAFS